MFGSTFHVLILSSIALGASTAEDKFTALKFGSDGYSFISFQPDMVPLADKFSFCVWVNSLEFYGQPIVFAYETSELFIFDNGNYRLFGRNRNPSRQITAGQWSQFCGTWSEASETFRAYINGTVVDTHTTTSGRKLKIGGTLVLGDYLDPNSLGGRTNNHFGGEMYNFNFFSKELTATEVASLSAGGLCTLIPAELEDYRVIKWEEILKLDRSGTVQDIMI